MRHAVALRVLLGRVEAFEPALPARRVDEQGPPFARTRGNHAVGLQPGEQPPAERAAEVPAALGPVEARLHAIGPPRSGSAPSRPKRAAPAADRRQPSASGSIRRSAQQRSHSATPQAPARWP